MENKPVISVRGMAHVSVPPDITVITFEITNLDREYARSMEALNERVAALRKRLSQAGFKPEDLKTTNFGIDSEYENRRNPSREVEQVFVGWKARHDMRLQLPTDRERVNQAITAIASDDVQSKIHVAFEVSDPAALRSKILDAATKAARKNAETIAAAAGCQLGKVLKIEYGWSELRVRSLGYDFLAEPRSSSMATPDIEPEDVGGEDSVTMIFELLA